MRNFVAKLREQARRAAPALAFAALALANQPAHAAAMDFQAGVITLCTALLVVFGAIVLVVAAYKGVEAVMDHRSVMPSMIGLVFGLSLVFGGAWYLTQLGAGAGAASVANI